MNLRVLYTHSTSMGKWKLLFSLNLVLQLSSSRVPKLHLSLKVVTVILGLRTCDLFPASPTVPTCPKKSILFYVALNAEIPAATVNQASPWTYLSLGFSSFTKVRPLG